MTHRREIGFLVVVIATVALLSLNPVWRHPTPEKVARDKTTDFLFVRHGDGVLDDLGHLVDPPSFYKTHLITNAEFKEFMAETQANVKPQWGVYYCHPGFVVWDGDKKRVISPGDNSTSYRDDLPVRVTQRDAARYCTWRGLRLPTRQEFVKGSPGYGMSDAPLPYLWGHGPEVVMMFFCVKDR